MTKRSKDKSVGPWAKEKLDALGQYLNFYTTVLKNQGHWLRGIAVGCAKYSDMYPRRA